ncbi:MAG: oligosaccharyl transferase, archaeosortase A system-associated [Dehalococcoidia bacterium]|nr:oligosaccharyl transferase, archaeosortase A system-associated [Dehalococcoidia bacterium]MDD5493128.1 oligosaccharyl transferase, archaeosortase A system-associated [Dehalococcoidia bacterium]
MNQKRIPLWLVVGIILFIIVLIALWLRIALPYKQVFVGEWVKMTGIDAYYYMRLVDNLVRHFPNLTQFDPYYQYPGGVTTGGAPNFFAYFMAAIIWLLGLGSPDQHIVDVIAVYIPPLMAALTIILVFFIGKTIAGKWMGLLAAGLLAIMPGEFLNRSMLGYTDHHIAEVLFSTIFMLFVFLSLKSGEGASFDAIKLKQWKLLNKPIIYGALAGFGLALYTLTWAGALLFVLVVLVFLIIQVIVDHLRGRKSDYIALALGPAFIVAILGYIPWARDLRTMLSLVMGLAVTVVLVVLSDYMLNRGYRRFYYPVAVFAMGVTGALALYLVYPELLISTTYQIASLLFTWGTSTTVMEMQPLLMYQGDLSFVVAFGNYTTAFIFCFAGLGLLIYQALRRDNPDRILLIIWSVIVLLSTLSMRRFAYYFAVNVALLTGYLTWMVLQFAMTRKEEAKPAALPVKPTAKNRKKIVTKPPPSSSKKPLIVALLILLILLLVYYPNFGPLPDGQRPSIDLASRPLFAPSNAWCESLDWLRSNSPDPLSSADAYYAYYRTGTESQNFSYTKTEYGVLNWWDYGYWVTRIGRRLPASNPGTGEYGEARYYTAQDEFNAGRAINNYGTRYVIVDYEIASYNSKFHALASLSGENYSRYFDLFVQKQGTNYQPVVLFFPEYYRSMVVRLYNFDGKAVIPQTVTVINTADRVGPQGKIYKEIMDIKEFATFTEAQEFINSKKSDDYLIVSDDPLKSPVPLAELTQYSLQYSSSQKNSYLFKPISDIKIFEYRKLAIPITGDWDGRGITKLGEWQPDESCFLLDVDGDGIWNPDKGDAKLGPFGFSTDIPLIGDWTGDGKDKIGVWRPSELCFYLDSNGDGVWNPEKGDRKLGPYGLSFNNTPVVGDWNGDGKDEIGVWGNSRIANKMTFYLNIAGDGNWNSENGNLIIDPFGKKGNVPVIGDWNNDGKDEIGVWDPVSRDFYLDAMGKGVWDESKGVTKIGPFGETTFTPLSGRWNDKNGTKLGMWDPQTGGYYLDVSGERTWGDNSSIIKLNPFTRTNQNSSP